jgi:hypothetical protein
MHGQVSVNEAQRAQRSHTLLAPPGDATQETAPDTLADTLEALFASAEIVFAGEVMRIERNEDVVAVQFFVSDGIRGVVTGSTYSLHEWSGLWVDNAQRYSVGQRLLMLLHAPSVTGLASPVSDGSIVLNGDAMTGSADLRWVALQRRRRSPSPAGAKLLSHSTAVQADTLIRAEADVVSAGEGTSANHEGDGHVDLAVVMDMLHAWQRRAERPQ